MKEAISYWLLAFFIEADDTLKQPRKAGITITRFAVGAALFFILFASEALVLCSGAGPSRPGLVAGSPASHIPIFGEWQLEDLRPQRRWERQGTADGQHRGRYDSGVEAGVVLSD
jgi:hypothetical protein